MYVCVNVCIYTHISTYTYRYIDFTIQTYSVYLCKYIYMYIYVYTYIQMIPIKRTTTYFHLLNCLKRKYCIFSKCKNRCLIFVVPGEDSHNSNIRK